MDKQTKLDLITTVMIAGFGVAIIYHYIVGKYLGLSYPHDAFLFTPDDKFRDFLNMLDYRSFFSWLFKNDAAANAIFPVMGWLISPFSAIKNHNTSLTIFLGISITFITLTTWYQIKGKSVTINIRYLFVLTFMSFPVLFLLDRANFEIFVYIFLFGFVFFYVNNWYYLSVLMLSLAICLKIFPAVFLVLFVSDKKYVEALLTVLLTMGLTVIPLSLSTFGLERSLAAIASNLDSYNKLYALKDMGLDFGHSAFGLLKVLLYRLHLQDSIAYCLRPYTLVVLCLFIIVSCHIIFVETQLWKKVMLLVASMCLFPHVSADYKLLHIYIPMFLFLNTPDKDRNDFLYALLFSLLLIPKNYRKILKISGSYPGIVIDPLLLTVFMMLIIYSGIMITRREDVLLRFKAHRQALAELTCFWQR